MDTGIVDNLQKNIHQNTLIYHNAEIFPGIFSVAAPVIRKQKVYRCAKRGFDIFFSVVLGIVLIVSYVDYSNTYSLGFTWNNNF